MKRTKTDAKPASTTVRCAIYSRKSTEEGLEQEFNSLDAQRESAEAYIASQKQEGWTCLADRYDDGGFTGGNMDRPALKRLLADIEVGKVDCVIVYKVDRLSRSLLDFARLVEIFEKHRVSFVSVTQQFNTATSMGRLVAKAETRLAELRHRIEEHQQGQLEARDIDAAFADFDNVWNALSPREQSQVLALLVARDEFDAADSTVAVSFHPTAIKTLAQKKLGGAA